MMLTAVAAPHHLGLEKLEVAEMKNLTAFLASLSHQGSTLLSFA
jgi:hypothetical protein